MTSWNSYTTSALCFSRSQPFSSFHAPNIPKQSVSHCLVSACCSLLMTPAARTLSRKEQTATQHKQKTSIIMKYQAALFWGGGKCTFAQKILVATLISSANAHFFSNSSGFQQATNDHFIGKSQIITMGVWQAHTWGNHMETSRQKRNPQWRLLRLGQPKRDYLYPDSASNHQVLASKPARTHSPSHPR